MHRAAVGGQLVDQRVDLRLGADVDAARRLVEDEDAGTRAASHFASTIFCWLPPDSPAVEHVGARGAHAQALEVGAGQRRAPRRGG